jgi:O-6-methylguanine DNA methyltransferase
MTPLERSSLQIAWIESPVGLLRAGASDTALQLLEFVAADSNPLPANPGQLRVQPGEIPTHPGANTPLLDQTRRELAEYFLGRRRRFEVPLSFPGTPFQERVWSALCSIGYGERISYLEQSRRVGDEKAIRAVAQANGQNPIAILVPCHRVINSDGKLGGYGGGLLRKQFLLDLERGDRLL